MDPEELDDHSRYRHLLTLQYSEIAGFVIDYLKRKSTITLFFWTVCIVELGLALTLRINVAHSFEYRRIFLHSVLGMIVFPVLVIPVHEGLHVIPYFLSGARRIKAGMDLKQFIFYVTAHRHVVTRKKFILVALVPFLMITLAASFLILYLPGLWKWSLSFFLFVHTTMCAGDFAMLNYYFLNRQRKIFTWDDAERMEAYFYEEIR
ncbi:MAG TPA: DUF3267 domain-containing protein [Bacteroidales bacterium]|nr:DUF3267 domain-containing protein [Bacteroidales bacterium]